jgi:diguanylate cyclase (GGDEF)-like protein/PAS domain S-box-containing protein
MSQLELLISPICTGVLATGLFLLVFISWKTRSKLHQTMVMVCLLTLAYVLCDTMMLLSCLKQNDAFGMQVHRIQQIATTFLVFFISPLFLARLLDISPLFIRINRFIATGGLLLSIIITVIAFLAPDAFISITTIKPSPIGLGTYCGHGQEGIVYTFRDIILSGLVIYALAAIAYAMFVRRSFRELILPVSGAVISLTCTTLDILYYYTGYYHDIFSYTGFSRTVVGITVFVCIMIIDILRRYINEAKKVEKSYEKIHTAYDQLNASEERFRQLADTISELYLLTDMENCILYASPVCDKIFGKSSALLKSLPMTWMDAIHQDDRPMVAKTFGSRNIPDGLEISYRVTGADGGIHWLRDRIFTVKDMAGRPYRRARVIEDITERRKTENELYFLSYHDVLTGLPNRTSFHERLHDTIVQARRSRGDRLRAIILIDIDNLRDINNTLGQSAGDAVLTEVARRISRSIRDTDYAFRAGGDQFAIILTYLTQEVDASNVAQKLIDMISTPLYFGESEIYTCMSAGICLYPKDGVDSETLLKSADIALGDAKKIPENSFSFYDREMNEKALEKLTLESNLRRALELKQFELLYQPIISIDGGLAGMEALLRWHHPVLGTVTPGKFIPLAESTGLIVPIGEWVLKSACRFLKNLSGNRNGISISINLSARQFREDNLVLVIEQAIEDTGIDPRSLIFEITESSVMENPEAAIQKMNELYRLGIGICLDDFGTGYSSLSYIRRFPISGLKIDRSFIMGLPRDAGGAELIKGIIALAHSLQLSVTAEGVETAEQAAFLKSLMCDRMQGFYFSKSVSAEIFNGFLDRKFDF